MRFVIGVDIGTQGSKGALLSAAGRVLVSHSIEHQLSIPRPGWAEHDADRVWWGGFVAVIKELLARSQIDPRQVTAIGVSGLMPVMLPVDVDGRPLRPAILYADTRARAELALMNEQLVGRDAPRLTAQDAGPKIIWFREHESARWQRTNMIVGA